MEGLDNKIKEMMLYLNDHKSVTFQMSDQWILNL